MFEDTILKAFFTMAICVIALGGLFFLLKKFGNKYRKFQNSVDLQIISKMPLQQKTNLFVVKTGYKTLLIGVTDHNIAILADLTEEKDIPKVTNDVMQKLENKSSELLSNLSNKSNQELKAEESLSFRSFLRSNLRKSN